MTKEECEKFVTATCKAKGEKTLNYLRINSCYILPDHIVSIEIFRTLTWSFRWKWGLRVELSTGRTLRVTDI
jgi:hypothetical protein